MLDPKLPATVHVLNVVDTRFCGSSRKRAWLSRTTFHSATRIKIARARFRIAKLLRRGTGIDYPAQIEDRNPTSKKRYENMSWIYLLMGKLSYILVS